MGTEGSGQGAGSTGGSESNTGAENTQVQNQGQQSQGQSSGQSQESQDQAKKEAIVEKYKLKIDGEESDYTLDEIKQMAQKAKGAEKRMQEGSTAKKQAEQFVNLLKNDITALLKNKDLGLNKEQVRAKLEEYLYEEYKWESLSEEERQVLTEREELKQIKQEREEAKRQQQEAQERALEERLTADYDRQFTEALNASGLPKVPKTVQYMIQHMTTALQAGIKVTPMEVAQLVREDYEREMKEIFGSTDKDTLAKILGEGKVRELREADIGKLKNPLDRAKVNDGKGGYSAPKKTAQKLSKDEWREKLRRVERGEED